MPVNPADLRVRKEAAKSALRFFKICQIKSPNNSLAWFSRGEREYAWNSVVASRQGIGTNTIAQTFEHTARTGYGNCDEKARVCYSSLYSNPRLTNGHEVTLCGCIGYDHAIVLVTDAPLTGATTLDALGESALVVDGWTEDWYFPNLANMDALKYGVLSVAVGRQIVVRYKTKNAQVAAQANVRMTPSTRIHQEITGLPAFQPQ